MDMKFLEEFSAILTPEQRQLARVIMQKTIGNQMSYEKQDKIMRYRRLNKMVRPHQILFVGSSLMEQFPIYELLLDGQLPYTIYNRGVGGFTTQELLQNMAPCIYDLQPDYIYINIGTNDLNDPEYTETGLINRYRQILKGIREHLPTTKLHLLAYYPVNPVVAESIPHAKAALQQRTNARILSANAAVQKLAAEFGAEYLDLNAGITDTAGNLKAEYTIEGMHIYGDGYKPVLDALLPYLPHNMTIQSIT